VDPNLQSRHALLPLLAAGELGLGMLMPIRYRPLKCFEHGVHGLKSEINENSKDKEYIVQPLSLLLRLKQESNLKLVLSC